MSEGVPEDIEPPYDKADLIEGLEYCAEKHGDIKQSTINEDDEIPFSSMPVQSHFDSLDNAREEIGLEPTGNGSRLGFQMDAIEEAEEADQYVYVIKLARADGEDFFYAGSVNGDKHALSARMSRHKMNNGDCRGPVLTDGGEEIRGNTDGTRQNQYEFIGIELILPVEANDNANRLREVERRTSCWLVSMYGRNALGGR